MRDNLNPVVFAVLVILVVAVIGFFGYRALRPSGPLASDTAASSLLESEKSAMSTPPTSQ